MKKAYLKTYTEHQFNQMVGINMELHDGKLRISTLNDDDIREIKSNLLQDEHMEFGDKKIIVKGSTDYITIQKFLRTETNTYVYLFIEQQNKLTVHGGITRIFIKEVER